MNKPPTHTFSRLCGISFSARVKTFAPSLLNIDQRPLRMMSQMDVVCAQNKTCKLQISRKLY